MIMIMIYFSLNICIYIYIYIIEQTPDAAGGSTARLIMAPFRSFDLGKVTETLWSFELSNDMFRLRQAMILVFETLTL